MTAIIADIQISGASRQYVRVPISEVSGGNPTSDQVFMAFPAPGAEPVSFYNASWLTLSGLYYVQCLVGPGGVVDLQTGYYSIFVKITDNPEVPVLSSGLLEVT